MSGGFAIITHHDMLTVECRWTDSPLLHILRRHGAPVLGLFNPKPDLSYEWARVDDPRTNTIRIDWRRS